MGSNVSDVGELFLSLLPTQICLFIEQKLRAIVEAALE